MISAAFEPQAAGASLDVSRADEGRQVAGGREIVVFSAGRGEDGKAERGREFRPPLRTGGFFAVRHPGALS